MPWSLAGLVALQEPVAARAVEHKQVLISIYSSRPQYAAHRRVLARRRMLELGQEGQERLFMGCEQD